MPRKGDKKTANPHDIAARNYADAVWLLRAHPMFASLARHSSLYRREGSLCPPDGWAVVTSDGDIHVHPTRRAEPEEWLYMLAHCLLHLGFGHFNPPPNARGERPLTREWVAACDCSVARFLAELKLGRPPAVLGPPPEAMASSEARLADLFRERGIPTPVLDLSLAGPGRGDMLVSTTPRYQGAQPPDWTGYFGSGLALAVTGAVEVAAGRLPALGAARPSLSLAQQARAWFISSYPLLGALAAGFDIVEDPALCARLDISVAAVSIESREIFINPAAGLDADECRFVMAHELLHVGLRHDVRCRGRDPFLWNIAADYVINAWLVEMGVGELPQFGALYDPSLKGESAESIYDRIVTDLRRYRRLATLRGVGLGDILPHGTRAVGACDGMDLDEFYRRCLGQGLLAHQAQGRGLLPAGLIEEIRALEQPPVPWDVELAQWFDEYFAPLEQVRSYARPSRRQSATPDIPRPRWVPAPDAEDGRTFGVVLDTSGSMDRALLAKALGAIASYSLARDVAAVRVVFCDAATYDQGYLRPEDIAGRVRVRGRGGTVLQPAIDLLETADDFPDTGPLLIITDGYCDRLRIRREHAFLLPRERHLPFVPRGKIFRIR